MHINKLVFSVLLAATFASAATEVSHTRYRNETVRAEYSWIENGCVSKQLQMIAAKNAVRQDGTTDIVPSTTLLYSIYDFCDINNVTQTFWWGTSSNVTLNVDSNLKSASLFASAFNVAGERYIGLVRTDLGVKPLQIDMRWASNDPKDKTASTFVTRFPGYLEVSHINGAYRSATATGLVADGTQNWFPVMYEGNLVQIFRVFDGETIVTKE
jgi:hypothetical protein